MKITNLVLLCKGFYKFSGDFDTHWIDMSLAIQADGYMCFTRCSVAGHCISLMEDFANEFPNLADKVSFPNINRKIVNNRFLWMLNHTEDLSYYDHIICAFIDFVRYELDYSVFDGGVLPNEVVLPLNKGCDDESMKYHLFKMEHEYNCRQVPDSEYNSVEERKQYINI